MLVHNRDGSQKHSLVIYLLVWHKLHVVLKRQRVEHDLCFSVPAVEPAQADEAMRCEAICSYEAFLSGAD